MFTLFRIVATIVPGLAMLAGHWLPWPTILDRRLRRVEAYAFGISWIIGTAAGLMRLAQRWRIELEPGDCATLVETAAASAGLATLAAYAIDAWTQDRKAAYAERLIANAGSLRPE